MKHVVLSLLAGLSLSFSLRLGFATALATISETDDALRGRRRLQDDGDEVCACQPASISFRLALNQSCDDAGAGTGTGTTAGIVDYECITESLLSPTAAAAVTEAGAGSSADGIPVVVVSLLFLELDANDQIIGRSASNGTFVDGDVVGFRSSVVASPSSTSTRAGTSASAYSYPKSLQVVLRGHDTLGDASSGASGGIGMGTVILNTFLIEYSTDCLAPAASATTDATSPMLTVGQRLGWFIVTGIGPPSVDFCPSYAGAGAATATATTVTTTVAPTTNSAPVTSPVERCTRTTATATGRRRRTRTRGVRP